MIAEALGRGRNAMAIWQDLVDDHGFRARYASVKRFVLKLRGSAPAEARVVITTAPGEEAQVDYGEGPMVRDAGTGKYRRTRLFVMTLGYSRKSVRLIVARSSAQVWAELHERAFRRLGGTVRILVLDNLREGVIAPDVYDPTLNPLYRDVLAYYGVVALPCRVRDPDRKGKVESAVGHAQKTPLKGLRFETLEEAQAYLDRWEEHWADTRIHGTTKRQVSVMFAEEKPALRELPLEDSQALRPAELPVRSPERDEPLVAVIEGVAADFDGILSPNECGSRLVHSVYQLGARIVQTAGPIPLLIDHDEASMVGVVSELRQEGSVVRFTAELHLARPGAREALSGVRDGARRCVSLGFKAPNKRENFCWGMQVYREVVPLELSLVRRGADVKAYVTSVDGESLIAPEHVRERLEREYRAKLEIEAPERALEYLNELNRRARWRTGD